MSNKIVPVDQGMHKVGDKINETATTRKLNISSAVSGKKAKDQAASVDTVELTQGAKLLERIEKTLAEVPEVDSARIAAVRADIASGNYEINADKIAEALMRTELELSE